MLAGGRFDKLVVETESGGTRDFGPGAVKSRGRGSKGEKPFLRTKFARVVPPPIELTDWEDVEGKKPAGAKNGE